jgi:Zn-dependent protease
MFVEFGTDLVRLSLFLFFFNMLPIPPLDGSRVARRLVGMKEETFAKIAQYGIYMLIIAINIPPIMIGLVLATEISSLVLGRMFGLPLSEINLGQIG